MKTRIPSLAVRPLACLSLACLSLAAGAARAQDVSNRRLLPGDVLVAPTTDPDFVTISLRSRAVTTSVASVDLSCFIRVFVNGAIVVEAPQFIIIGGGGQTCNGSCPTGDCSSNGQGSTCSDFAPLGQQGCACDVVVTPNNPNYTARARPGDVIGVVLDPIPGSLAEQYTADDFLVFTYGAACDPDVNADGNIDQDDIDYLVNVIGGGPNTSGADPDFNHDGNVDQDDVDALINVVAGGQCP